MRRYKKFSRTQEKTYNINERIRIPKVRVIDENNQQLGIMDTSQALNLAREKHLDLIEVSPKADPPVCKIVNRGQFQYQLSKQKQQKIKKIELKIVRISFKIGKHDLAIKAERIKKFIDQSHKVKIETILRGRERQHKNLAKENIENLLQEHFTEIAKIDQPLKIQGNNLSIIITKAT